MKSLRLENLFWRTL
ncbi:DUF1752 domain-containing protein [Brachyspira pilosicoli]|nr:DUF1752 domain-containing protein [Brachyspira pilosicoli]